MANLTDADKVLRNDVGKDIVTKLNNIATAIQTSGTTSLYVIADAFDSTATYDVGDYVIYNSSLYKCTTAVSVAGAFDPSDWEVVQVMDEIPDNLAGAIAMTQAQWDAIVDKTAWRNAHKNSYLIITDAPNLNPTASDIEYSSGVTVKQAIDGKANTSSFTKKTQALSSAVTVTANSIDSQTFSVTDSVFGIVVGFAITNSTNFSIVQAYIEGTTLYTRVRNNSSSSDSYKITVWYI